MVSGPRRNVFIFFSFLNFFLSSNPLSLFVVWSPPLSSNFLWKNIFFRENDRKSVYRKKKMRREEDEERGGALDPLLLSEEVDSEEEDKEETGEIDDCEA